MTGLYPGVDALVEVAIIITDADLNILDDGIDIIIKPPAAAVEQMDPVVVEMHRTNGLAEQWEHGVSAAEAEKQLLDYVKQYCPEPRTALLAGNTVGQDQRFLFEEMPDLAAHLHYRIVDVSSIKELAKRWYPTHMKKPQENWATTERLAISPIRSTNCDTTVKPSWCRLQAPQSTKLGKSVMSSCSMWSRNLSRIRIRQKRKSGL